jgi:predicted MPP superfamily phosphohydrolase
MNKRRIISIGDLHGRDYWRELALWDNPDKYDHIVFVGDYVDSFDKSNVEILHNLIKIIEFKKKYPEKVILLLGNHDVDYMLATSPAEFAHRCTGFRPEAFWDLKDMFRRNMRLFDVAFQIDNYIWTHAGIHAGWYEYKIEKYIEIGDENLAYTLNRLFWTNHEMIFDNDIHRGGRQKYAGILWADKVLLITKPLKGYHQIFGHTAIDSIKHYNKKNLSHLDENTSITNIDCNANYDILEEKIFYTITL